MRINPFVLPILIVAALFGTVWTAQATGNWSTSGRVTIDPTKMTTSDLKGWMTLQEVMNGLQISQDKLYSAGKIPADIPASTALNKLESLVPGFSVTTLRETLANMLNNPAANPAPSPTETGTAAPVPEGTSTPTAKGSEAATTPTPLPAGVALTADQIKGKMTLREVSTLCAVSLEALIQELDLHSSISPDTTINDLISQGQLAEVTVVQQTVAEMQIK